MTTSPFDLDAYRVRRKVLKIFGASFHVYDGQGRVVAFSKQKAFKLKEDIRVFTDESMSGELLTVRARQIVDFSAAYDVVDARESTKVGAARRKGWKSILRDKWELLDENDQHVATLEEDSGGMAFLRRFLSNLIPQRFHLDTADGVPQADFEQRFNPFVYKLDVKVRPDATLDRRLIFAAAVLLAAIEGRQG
jgi:hypothetical protein